MPQEGHKVTLTAIMVRGRLNAKGASMARLGTAAAPASVRAAPAAPAPVRRSGSISLCQLPCLPSCR